MSLQILKSNFKVQKDFRLSNHFKKRNFTKTRQKLVKVKLREL